MRAAPLSDVAWIDPDLVGSMFNRRDRQPVIKVDIRNQRD